MSKRQSQVSPFLAAAQSTRSEVLSDFQTWCSLGCQMHLGTVTMKISSQSLSASLPHQLFTGFTVLVMNSTFVYWLSYLDIAWLAELVSSCSFAVPEEHRSVAWHSWRPHGWWGRRAWGRRWMINLMPWRCHGCWRGQAWGRTRWETRNHYSNFLLVVDGVSLLVEEVHDKFPKIFEAIVVTISLISWKTCCARTSCFGGWWKPVWFSKKVFLNFSSFWVRWLPSRWMFSEPDLLQ